MIVKQLRENLFDKKLGRPKIKESIQESIQPEEEEYEEYTEFEEEEEEQVQEETSNYGFFLVAAVLIVALGIFIASKMKKNRSKQLPSQSASANRNGVYNPYQNF